MKFALFLLALMLAIPASGRCASAQVKLMTRTGEWLQYRGDSTLTGRSSLKGAIVKPEVAWKHFVGARETLFAVHFGGGNSRIALPDADVRADDRKAVEQTWGLGTPRFDLDGDGNMTAFSPTILAKVGKFIRGRQGLQKIEFVSCFSKAGMLEAPGRLFARKNGEWEQIWESKPIPKNYRANAIVGDFDGDGKLEVASVLIDQMWLMDLATGEFRDSCRFFHEGQESGRANGWFGAFDVNGDGKQEFIIIGDHQEHVDVIGWENGKLKLWWSYIPEMKVTGKHTLLRTGVNPVEDVDGDGKLEITVSVFDEANDSRWHTVVLDSETGNKKFDLVDLYLVGICDVDGDGAAELFCVQTPASRLIPTPGHLSVLNCKGGKVATRWSLDGAEFQTHVIQDFPLNVNSGSATGGKTLLWGAIEPDSKPAFFTKRLLDTRTGIAELRGWRADSAGRIVELGSISGPHVEAVATSPDKGVLVRVQALGDGEASLRCSQVKAEVLLSAQSGVPLSPVTVAKLKNGSRPAIVVQGACETLVAFQPPNNGQPAMDLWRACGRGTHLGGGVTGSGQFGGVMLADMFGDGRMATITATRGPIGQARMLVLDPDGKEVWHHDFDAFPGEPPEWNLAGITYWYPGHFTSRDHCDILVNMRPSQDNILYMLDGRTGDQIWERSQVRVFYNRMAGAGGLLMSIYDYDGNGLDDALSAYYALVDVFEGSTGKLLLHRDTGPDGIFRGLWLSGTYPVVTDFLGNGEKQILYFSWGKLVRGLLNPAGRVIWCEASTEFAGTYNKVPETIWHESTVKCTYSPMPGVGDVDGDGKTEIIAIGDYEGSDPAQQLIQCYDAANGSVKWKLELGTVLGVVMSAATADIDGDGRDECIFGIGNTVYAVGTSKDGKSGELRWKIDLPAEVGPPAIADADGSGRAQIVVLCADGFVYGIGPARKD